MTFKILPNVFTFELGTTGFELICDFVVIIQTVYSFMAPVTFYSYYVSAVLNNLQSKRY